MEKAPNEIRSMNDRNTKGLVSDFPKIFRKIETLECGDGWEAIIREACEKIEPILKDGIPDDQNLFAVQIKEKFGGLRFYRSHAIVLDLYLPDGVQSSQTKTSTPAYSQDEIDAIDAAIKVAQNKSTSICEICGKPGERRKAAWTRTLCDDHEKKRIAGACKTGEPERS